VSISQDRIQRERERALRASKLSAFTDMTQAAAKTYRRPKSSNYSPVSTKRTAPSVAALTPPAPSAAAQVSPARRKAEAEGYANFGKRTWFLVSREESFRAVESLDDAPGWSLVTEMKR